MHEYQFNPDLRITSFCVDKEQIFTSVKICKVTFNLVTRVNATIIDECIQRMVSVYYIYVGCSRCDSNLNQGGKDKIGVRKTHPAHLAAAHEIRMCDRVAQKNLISKRTGYK